MAASKNRKPRKTAKNPVKPLVAPAPAAPRPPIQLNKNKTGESQSYDAALDLSVELLAAYYHNILQKYVTEDNKAVMELTIPGQGGDPIKVACVDALAEDLKRVNLVALYLNALQRTRTDEALEDGARN